MENADLAIKKVKEWHKRKISKYRIAKEIGVSWVTVSRWLKSTHKISYEISKKILETEI